MIDLETRTKNKRIIKKKKKKKKKKKIQKKKKTQSGTNLILKLQNKIQGVVKHKKITKVENKKLFDNNIITELF